MTESNNEGRRVHLLLGAGGVRCVAYIGALMQLEREHYEIATVSSCSAGMLIGALYCAGVAPPAMLDATRGLKFADVAGDVRRRRLRRLWTLRSWPYAFYRSPGVGRAFAQIASTAGVDPDPTLGQLKIALSTAAVDVAGQRLLVYSSERHPDMQVRELLDMAVAIPLWYRPYERQGRDVMDGSLASLAPVWLATGQVEDLPIIVLRTRGRRTPTRKLAPWVREVVQSGVVGRDTFDLERVPRLRVYDIDTHVDSMNFDLSRDDIDRLVEDGRRTVAEGEERARQPLVVRDDSFEAQAEREATGLYRRHLDRLARDRRPTVFLSYAREDRHWVMRLRHGLLELLADPSVEVWYDAYIRAGSLWRGAIEDAIARARVAILFVSEHFNRSSFTQIELEMLRARVSAGELRLLWVSIDGAQPPGEEQEIQGLGDPAHPLSSLHDAGAAKTIMEIARTIEEVYRSTLPREPTSVRTHERADAAGRELLLPRRQP